MSAPNSTATPGELLLHPAAVTALILLVVNDRWMKVAWPGTLSGKISDFSGLIIFPLALLSLLEISRRILRRPVVAPSDAAALVLTCGLGFVFVKATVQGRDAYAWVVGSIRWPFLTVATWIQGGNTNSIRPIGVVRDVTDLTALVALIVPFVLIRARTQRLTKPFRMITKPE